MDKHKPQGLEPIDPWTKLTPLNAERLDHLSDDYKKATRSLEQLLLQKLEREADQARRNLRLQKIVGKLLRVGKKAARAFIATALDELTDGHDLEAIAQNTAVLLVTELKSRQP